jgi:hypothetical protein
MVKKPARELPVSAPNACRECGTVLTANGRQYCDECLSAYQVDQAASFSDAGRAKLAELRAAGRDPSQTREARKQRGAKNSQRMQEQKRWEAKYGSACDPEGFMRDILPGLQGVSLSVMARATGLSEQYCSQIRRGLKVPHIRHWDSLRGLSHLHIKTLQE